MNLKSIITEFSHKYGQNAAKLEKEILTYVRAGMKPADAIKTAFKSTQFSQQVENDLAAAQKQAAGLNIGAGASMTTALNEPWDGTGVTFSQRLHGTSTAMQQAMTATIKDQLKLGATAVQVARALYSGYNDGHVIRQQDTPGYMDRLVQFARKSTLSLTEQRDLMRSVRVAKRQIESLAQNGAPTSALRAAYSKLLDAILAGNDKNIARAVNVAVNEKSRYIAERIARTEAGRAYFDGVIAKYQDDPTVVAYKWELGSRHPEPDICDMFAQANMFGLGVGVFPKDKLPAMPVHPNCLCLLYPVYAGEIKSTKQTDPGANGAAWLRDNPKAAANILPVGKSPESWQRTARGYNGFAAPVSRLTNTDARVIINKKEKVILIRKEFNN